MALLVFDYSCTTCEETFYDMFVNSKQVDEQVCEHCGELLVKKIPKPRVDWDALAMGSGASPEAIRHWEKKRSQQQKKEEKSKRDHGDIGKAPGS